MRRFALIVIVIAACSGGGRQAPSAPEADEVSRPLPGRTEPITADPARDQAIIDQWGEGCELRATCGGLWGIDCGAASDGPFYYVDAKTMQIVSTCGGFCMIDPDRRCERECPPPAWDCHGRRTQ